MDDAGSSPALECPVGSAVPGQGCGCTTEDGRAVLRCDLHVRAALSRPSDLSSSAFADLYGPAMGRRALVSLDGDAHRRLRHALSALFSAEVLSELWQPAIERCVDRSLTDLLVADRHAADLVPDLAYRVPAETLAVAVGVDPGAWPLLAELAHHVVHFYEDPKSRLEAAYRLRRYAAELVAARARENSGPETDIVGMLLGLQVDRQHLDEREVVDALRLLVPAGIETTATGIANVVYALLHGGTDIEAALPSIDQLPRIVEEALRWAPPTAWVVRRASQTTVLDGLTVDGGSIVYLSLFDANHDESRYPVPNEMDPQQNGVGSLTFGFGRHTCLGARLAPEEIRSAVAGLRGHMPDLRLDPNAEVRGPSGGVIHEVATLPVIW